VLGSRLRRQQRARESRPYLRAARDGFDSLGASSWAGRARDELRAAGVPSPAPAPDAWKDLSPQELQIARMVAEGLSNREIGERLYLSSRTVSSHLYRIFPKLGITSRVQLTALSLGLSARGRPAAG
jgi:DNA-binding NarL/FixJ family response regulator